jgi:hypothetical protein
MPQEPVATVMLSLPALMLSLPALMLLVTV